MDDQDLGQTSTVKPLAGAAADYAEAFYRFQDLARELEESEAAVRDAEQRRYVARDAFSRARHDLEAAAINAYPRPA